MQKLSQTLSPTMPCLRVGTWQQESWGAYLPAWLATHSSQIHRISPSDGGPSRALRRISPSHTAMVVVHHGGQTPAGQGSVGLHRCDRLWEVTAGLGYHRRSSGSPGLAEEFEAGRARSGHEPCQVEYRNMVKPCKANNSQNP